MNISATFIRKPIATSLLMAAILLLGLISYELLPVAALPNIDTPTVLVTAQFPGADAQNARPADSLHCSMQSTTRLQPPQTKSKVNRGLRPSSTHAME